jgi:thymidylate synthase
MGRKYKFAQGEMDQVDNVLWLLKNTPYSRRILTNIFNFEDLHAMHLEPCAYSMTFNVTGNKLNAVLNQRSQDILAANNWNVVQYSVLVHMLAQVSGLVAGELVHMIADAHIYDRHVPVIRELIERPTYPAPKFSLNPEVKDFYDFTVNDINVEDYQKNPQIKGIPIAV